MSNDISAYIPPIGTLDEILEAGDATEKAVKVFVGHNLGNRTFLILVAMHEFYGMSEVANDTGKDGEAIAQRKLDPAHAQKLALYMLRGLVSAAIERRLAQKKPVSIALNQMMERLGRQPYMALQPLVVNVRDCNPRGADFRVERMLDKRTEETAAFKIFLSQRHVLWVIDGQHRRKAMQMVFDFLEGIRISRVYPKKNGLVNNADGATLTPEELKVWEECFETARSYCTLLVEVHLGLNIDEERQLFHDLNRLGKKVDTSLALQFDSSNPINLFIKEELIEKLGLSVSEGEVKNWKEDEGRLSRKDIVGVNAILFLNKTNISSATPQMIDGKTDIAYRFWTAVQAIPGFGENLAKENTVAGQPIVLKAIAKLIYDFSFSNRRPENGKEIAENVINNLTDIDFGHDNPMWRYYDMTTEEREKFKVSDLENYLPGDDGGNRDIGAYQNGFMRFGAKHNDIIPILGDMIRWKLNLPARKLNGSSVNDAEIMQ